MVEKRRAVVILLGPPGAGKGTQGRKLAAELGFPQISTGEILREAVRNKTELGRQAQKHMGAGTLVPDDLVDAIVRARLMRDDCEAGCILDGYPRTISQAGFLDSFCPEETSRVLAVGIEVGDQVLIGRIVDRLTCPKCGKIFNAGSNPSREGERCDECGATLLHRADDSATVMQERLQVYRRETKPLIQHYRERGAYVEVNGEKGVDEIYTNILEALRGECQNRNAVVD